MLDLTGVRFEHGLLGCFMQCWVVGASDGLLLGCFMGCWVVSWGAGLLHGVLGCWCIRRWLDVGLFHGLLGCIMGCCVVSWGAGLLVHQTLAHC